MAKLSPIPVIKHRHHHAQIIDSVPSEWQHWPMDEASANEAVIERGALKKAIDKPSKLKFPKQRIVFISDPHADAEAFEASLIAAGAAEREFPGLCNLKLTKSGKKSEIIIGGDCLDKGPSNLQLLRSIKHLYRIGANVTLLAGNHDLRLLMGLLTLKRPSDVGNQHMFVRMGKKVVPLFKEVFVNYLEGTDWESYAPSEEECYDALFPTNDWFDEFPYHAAGVITAEGIDRELRKMHSKVESFEQHCRKQGMTLQMVYATALKCQQLFMHESGEFYWFFSKMRLVEQRGSFLFLHAGLDDAMCHLLTKKGTKYANRAFHKNLHRRDLFSFYYSPIANTFRTKYRKADLPLTDRGVKMLHKNGIQILVQGHVNQHGGQRICVKQGLMHVETDVTLDINSRRKEGLEGNGVGATIIDKQVGIVGLSGDYPCAKVFHPKAMNKLRQPKPAKQPSKKSNVVKLRVA